MSNDVEVLNGSMPQMPRPTMSETGQLVELGTMLRELGLRALEARGIIDEIMALCNSMVLAAVPKIMARVQKSNQERMAILGHRIRMGGYMGMISKNEVLGLIAQTALETPRTGL